MDGMGMGYKMGGKGGSGDPNHLTFLEDSILYELTPQPPT